MNFDKWVKDGSGLLVPITRPVGIDLFCGAGGMSLGCIQGGWHIIAGMDSDPLTAMTYLYNLGSYPVGIHCATEKDQDRLDRALTKEYKRTGKIFLSGGGMLKSHPEMPPVYHFFFGDCRQFTGETILNACGLKRGQIDAVVGGPPCQGFSSAGKRNVMDPRNSLVFEFARLVVEMQPKTIVFENVPEVASMVTPDGLNVLDKFCLILQEGGFGTAMTLEKTLRLSAGMGAAIRHNRSGYKEAAAETEAEEPSQLSLFEGIAP